ncbi:uncharacterized protein C8A04DRAFT_25953 [Dichotomopilus funicola]|uniref:Uncharacterized protein n=1 Tax=Dichotomopilus funicola TaxID=1934379 RepID=A0AAN6V776_9PEZI|nr:hypothetical protein C8A04DRAFT_25953 [Dichotomopilus funicola]
MKRIVFPGSGTEDNQTPVQTPVQTPTQPPPTQRSPTPPPTHKDEPPQTPRPPATPKDETTQTAKPLTLASQQLSLTEIVVPSLKIGATTGTCGLFVGATAGIIRNAPVGFFSLFSAGQWFVLGSTFYGGRLSALQYFGPGEPVPRDKVKASAMGGAFAGFCSGWIRGPRNVIPGMICFSSLGAVGQALLNWRAARRERLAKEPQKETLLQWLNPIKPLSDEDYEKILEEKLLKVDVEIALIEDRIKELLDDDREKKAKAKAAAEAEAQRNQTPSSEQDGA